MTKYEKITAARKLLGLSETATLAEIKSGYHKLLDKWHPDKCADDPKKCAEMTRKIIAANEALMEYCRQYQYSFSEETVKKQLSPEQWWFERFGDDPLWGRGGKPFI
ncbi:MAG: J domain-containing protein [Desulfobacteraceae bacterium]|jgi:DnaJ-class molecular chaperone|nr:MAG: J domain-containing protein [Desulfobacteraceae bacterium]